MQQQWWEQPEKRRVRRERDRRERVNGEKIKAREKVEKSRSCWSGGCGAIRTWKIARHYGAKQILESKCQTHLRLGGALLEVQMSKKCTRLWREARFEAKTCKTPQHRTAFASWAAQEMKRRHGAKHISKSKKAVRFWEIGCRTSVRCCGAKHVSKSKCAAKNTTCSDQFVAGARGSAPCQKWAKKWLVAVAKTMAGVGCLKRSRTTLYYTTLHYTSLHYNDSYNYSYN